jgi:lipoprotein-anchoring transpeptidase ErfK/SrfK
VTGRHHVEHDGGARARLTRRGRTVAGAVAALATAGAVLAGAALAAPAAPPPPDPENSAVAQAAHAEPAAPGTPCAASVRACVDLEKQIAWIIRDGKVTRGPMTIASGGEHQATPVGHSYRVYRKEPDHKSGESRLPDGRPAPMPWSTFFADGGIAFHTGDPARSSAGCIRMNDPDARAVFHELRMGDKVSVVNGSVEWKHRHPGRKP